jgi:hypothetical protein
VLFNSATLTTHHHCYKKKTALLTLEWVYENLTKSKSIAFICITTDNFSISLHFSTGSWCLLRFLVTVDLIDIIFNMLTNASFEMRRVELIKNILINFSNIFALVQLYNDNLLHCHQPWHNRMAHFITRNAMKDFLFNMILQV